MNRLRLGIILSLVLFANVAFGINVEWTKSVYDTTNKPDGYIVYWEASDDPEVFSRGVGGADSERLNIPTDLFKPGIEYEFWVTGYNVAGESIKSTSTFWTRSAQGYAPPDDNWPTDTYPVLTYEIPNAVITVIITPNGN